MKSIPHASLFDGKACITCGLWKSFAEFHKAEGNVDGYSGQCRICRNAVIKQWGIRKQAEDPEYNKRKLKKWYDAHGVEYHQKWRDENRARMNANNRARYARDPQYHISFALARISKRRGAVTNHTHEEWEELCEKYGGRCLCCGKAEKLTRDHVVPLSLGGDDSIDNIQPLCHICNSRKNNRHIDYR